ncbi:MAG: cupredoxin domain-containing protein [Thermoleophilia bacterium]|nr:cupredoxin domain-containing protein [Thermoleophilia bacterium]
MQSRMARRLLLSVAAVALAGFAVGCGDDEGGEDGGEETAQVSETIEIEMDDFKFIPKNAKAKAGTAKIVAPNIGVEPHELELFKSDEDPGSLEVIGDSADTEPLGGDVGEAFADPGETGEFTVDLEPGKYAMICNLPNHYAQGMYGSLTVG